MKTATLAFIIAVFSLARIIYFMPQIGNRFYILLGITLFILLFRDQRYRIQLTITGFLLTIVCAASIFYNQIPALFQPWTRYGLFLTVVMLVGPFINTPNLCQFRLHLFSLFQFGFILIALGSFVGRFVGITQNQNNYWCGITAHSMLLAIVAANAAIYLLYTIACHPELYSKQRMLLFACVAICILMLMGSGSRASSIACIAGVITTFYLAFTNYQKLLIRLIYIGVAVIIITIPKWKPYLNNLKEKNKGDLEELNLNSRQEMWQQSWKSFQEAPVIGNGFSSIKVTEDNREDLINREGQIETGSSWLDVLSMTGVCGAFVILLILGQSRGELIELHKRGNPVNALFYGELIFYCIHMCAEGYIYAGGSMACFNFWLLLGTIATSSKYFHLLPQTASNVIQNDGSVKALFQLLLKQRLVA